MIALNTNLQNYHPANYEIKYMNMIIISTSWSNSHIWYEVFQTISLSVPLFNATVWRYVGATCGFIFLLIQLMMLVEFAHRWNTNWWEPQVFSLPLSLFWPSNSESPLFKRGFPVIRSSAFYLFLWNFEGETYSSVGLFGWKCFWRGDHVALCFCGWWEAWQRANPGQLQRMHMVCLCVLGFPFPCHTVIHIPQQIILKCIGFVNNAVKLNLQYVLMCTTHWLIVCKTKKNFHPDQVKQLNTSC